MLAQNTGLKNENWLRRVCPSIFATEPAEHVSEKYNFIPTYEVLRVFESMGWEASDAIQQHSRHGGDSEFHRKHTVTLTNPNFPTVDNGVGHLRFDCKVTNSHDWGSIFKAIMGIFRKVCSNGLYVPNGMCEHISVRHDNILNSVEEITDRFRAGIDTEIIPTVYRMSERILKESEIQDFATSARDLRYTDSVPPAALLRVRRFEDEGNDLWTIFNRVQENCTKGGTRERGMKRTTRDLKEVSRLAKVNTGLFDLALSYLEN